MIGLGKRCSLQARYGAIKRGCIRRQITDGCIVQEPQREGAGVCCFFIQLSGSANAALEIHLLGTMTTSAMYDLFVSQVHQHPL